MTPTVYLRHVWRILNDGNAGDVKVLALQQWREFADGEGWWEDVIVSNTEDAAGPEK